VNRYLFSTPEPALHSLQFHQAQMQPVCVYLSHPPGRVPQPSEADGDPQHAPELRTVTAGVSLLPASPLQAGCASSTSSRADLSYGEKVDDAGSGSASEEELLIPDHEDPDNGYILPRVISSTANLRRSNGVLRITPSPKKKA
jgi:hypothetical protein